MFLNTGVLHIMITGVGARMGAESRSSAIYLFHCQVVVISPLSYARDLKSIRVDAVELFDLIKFFVRKIRGHI